MGDDVVSSPFSFFLCLCSGPSFHPHRSMCLLLLSLARQALPQFCRGSCDGGDIPWEQPPQGPGPRETKVLHLAIVESNQLRKTVDVLLFEVARGLQ